MKIAKLLCDSLTEQNVGLTIAEVLLVLTQKLSRLARQPEKGDDDGLPHFLACVPGNLVCSDG